MPQIGGGSKPPPETLGSLVNEAGDLLYYIDIMRRFFQKESGSANRINIKMIHS